MAKTLRLGKTVEYRDSSGFAKAALVIGTRETVQDGTDVKRPAEGNANLRVYRAGGGEPYTRFDVKEGTGPNTWSFA